VSKSEDDSPFGAAQPPVRRSELRRRAQAAVLGGWVRDLLAVDPGAAVIVLGDLNEHWFGEPLAALASAGLESLIVRVPLEERYTYVHAGLSQVLDHVFVSGAIAAGAEVDVVHTNADFPAWRRASDHDAVVVRLRLGADLGATGRTGATRE
jgi:predicted extracellular nuclease